MPLIGGAASIAICMYARWSCYLYTSKCFFMWYYFKPYLTYEGHTSLVCYTKQSVLSFPPLPFLSSNTLTLVEVNMITTETYGILCNTLYIPLVFKYALC